MPELFDTLPEFTLAVQSGLYHVDMSQNGKWQAKRPSIFSTDDSLKKYFLKMLKDTEWRKTLPSYASFEKAAIAVKNRINDEKYSRLIDLHLIAMRHRREEIVDEISEINVETLAENWLKNQPLFISKTFSEVQKEQLDTLRRYPDFVQLLEQDKKLQDHFFKWALRDLQDISIFVSFPKTCMRLRQYALTGIIANSPKQILKVKTDEVGTKILTLPFRVSNEVVEEIEITHFKKRISLGGGKTRSLKEIFSLFKEKKEKFTPIEFVQGAISMFDAHRFGWGEKELFSPISLENEKYWWKEGLPFCHALHKEALETTLGMNVQKNQWYVALKSDRKKDNLNFNGVHTWIVLYVPNGKNWLSYPFGLAPKKQITPLDVTNTLRGTVTFDAHEHYSHTQVAVTPYALTKEEGLALFSHIRTDLLTERTYQVLGENCANWAVTKLEQIGIFLPKEGSLKEHVSVVDFEKNILGSIFKWVKDKPPFIQKVTSLFLEIILMAWREKKVDETFKSIWHSPFHDTQEIFHPPLHHERIENQNLSGHLLHEKVAFPKI